MKLAPRPVVVSRFEITSPARIVEDGATTYLDFDAVIECSSGTYIRALARDLGGTLNVGGHLTALRRTKINNYSVEDAQVLDGLTHDSLQVAPMIDAVKHEFPIRLLDDQEVVDLRHGKRIAANGVSGTAIAAVADTTLVAMLESVGEQLKSLVVFASDSDE